MRVLTAIDRAVEATGFSHAQIALAWIMAHPAVSAPIASATSVDQLEDLMAAVQLKLPSDVISALNLAR